MFKVLHRLLFVLVLVHVVPIHNDTNPRLKQVWLHYLSVSIDMAPFAAFDALDISYLWERIGGDVGLITVC